MKAITNFRIQSYWESLVTEHEQSGVDVDTFCAKRGICATSFYTRRKQLRLMGKAGRLSGFIQFFEKPAADKMHRPVVAARILPEADNRQAALPVRIQTPNGYSVEAVVGGIHDLARVFGSLKGL